MAKGQKYVTAESEPNLQILRTSRKKLSVGDVFAIKLLDDQHLFGRVIAADLPLERAPMPGANLLYIYRQRCQQKRPNLDMLTPRELLLPPLFTNRLAWTKGYFETLLNHPVDPSDLLQQHCFRRALTGQYLDEHRQPLPAPAEPCGEWSLISYLGIDDLISDALGYPRATTNEPSGG